MWWSKAMSIGGIVGGGGVMISRREEIQKVQAEEEGEKVEEGGEKGEEEERGKGKQEVWEMLVRYLEAKQMRTGGRGKTKEAEAELIVELLQVVEEKKEEEKKQLQEAAKIKLEALQKRLRRKYKLKAEATILSERAASEAEISKRVLAEETKIRRAFHAQLNEIALRAEENLE